MVTINSAYEVNWYSLFYLISSILPFVFLFYLGWKKGYPVLSWILILVTGALFFIVGTKLVNFRAFEWTNLFREGVFPNIESKSALGGLLVAILGIELSRNWLRIKEFVLDTYVLIVPLALAIQKPGCLLAGCCFGTQTSLPWGIRYAFGTPVHHHQWVSNTISGTESLSLPVHPVPFYEFLSYLVIFGILLLLGPRLLKRGSRFFLGLVMLCLSRFALEFLRDPVAASMVSGKIGGLRGIQWILLLSGLFTGLLFLRTLKQNQWSQIGQKEPTQPIWKIFIMILLLSILTWFVQEGFSPTEMLVLNLKFLTAMVFFGHHIWIRYTVPRFRLAGIFILILPLFIMGQTVPGKDGPWQYFHSFGAGGTFGSFGQEARYNEHEGGCGGPAYSRNYYDHGFGLATLNYNFTKQRGYISYSYGGSIFGGADRESEIGSSDSDLHSSFGIHPYFNINSRWIGLGLGASMGYLNYIPTEPFDKRSITTGIKRFPLLPSGSFRLGPFDFLDLEYRFMDNFPSQLPFVSHQISIGSGFGIKNGSGLRVGFQAPYEGFFVGGNMLIKDKFIIRAKYSNTYFEYGNSHVLSLGLNYRFSTKPGILKSNVQY